jgi:hypothetical protein
MKTTSNISRKIKIGLLTGQAIVSSILLFGCESKIAEKGPTEMTGIQSLNDRMSTKITLDKKLTDIDGYTEKIRRVVGLFKKIQSPTTESDVYTPIDFLIDLNKELKESIPTKSGGKQIRKGRFQLPIKGLAKNCSFVDTLLTSEEIISSSGTTSNNDGAELLTYAVKTCGTQDFINVVEIERKNTNVNLVILNENLNMIFQQTVQTAMTGQTTCSVKFDKSGILDAISCRNMKVALSASEIAIVDNLEYSNSAQIRMLVNA